MLRVFVVSVHTSSAAGPLSARRWPPLKRHFDLCICAAKGHVAASMWKPVSLQTHRFAYSWRGSATTRQAVYGGHDVTRETAGAGRNDGGGFCPEKESPRGDGGYAADELTNKVSRVCESYVPCYTWQTSVPHDDRLHHKVCSLLYFKLQGDDDVHRSQRPLVIDVATLRMRTRRGLHVCHVTGVEWLVYARTLYSHSHAPDTHRHASTQAASKQKTLAMKMKISISCRCGACRVVVGVATCRLLTVICVHRFFSFCECV